MSRNEYDGMLDPVWVKNITPARMLLDAYTRATNKDRVDMRRNFISVCGVLSKEHTSHHINNVLDAYEESIKSLLEKTVLADDEEVLRSARLIRSSVLCIASILAEGEDKGFPISDVTGPLGRKS